MRNRFTVRGIFGTGRMSRGDICHSSGINGWRRDQRRLARGIREFGNAVRRDAYDVSGDGDASWRWRPWSMTRSATTCGSMTAADGDAFEHMTRSRETATTSKGDAVVETATAGKGGSRSREEGSVVGKSGGWRSRSWRGQGRSRSGAMRGRGRQMMADADITRQRPQGLLLMPQASPQHAQRARRPQASC